MLRHAVCDLESGELGAHYASRDEAERELAGMLREQPSWVGRFEVVAVDFAEEDVTLDSLSHS